MRNSRWRDYINIDWVDPDLRKLLRIICKPKNMIIRLKKIKYGRFKNQN